MNERGDNSLGQKLPQCNGSYRWVFGRNSQPLRRDRKMVKGSEHLAIHAGRAGTVLNRRLGGPYQCGKLMDRRMKKRWSQTFLSGHKLKYKNFHLNTRTFLKWRWSNSGIDCPEKSRSLHLWRHSEPDWTRSWATCPCCLLLWAGGLDQNISRGPFQSSNLKYSVIPVMHTYKHKPNNLE